ncbi:MAG: hypothetical protein IT424_12975 [Pirellulales bacterium]|nr:hypothetical protein [Pirellulales bacterium]
MTSPSRQNRVDAPPQADGVAAPCRWPVLASLPCVAPLAGGARSPAPDALDQIDEVDELTAQVARLQAVAARHGVANRRARDETLRRAAVAPDNQETAANRTTQQRRIDPADHRGQTVATPAILRDAAAPRQRPSLAGRAFQWQTARTPNASAAVTAAMVVAAALCWLAFSRPQAAAPSSAGARSAQEPIQTAAHAKASPKSDSTASHSADDTASHDPPIAAAAAGPDSGEAAYKVIPKAEEQPAQAAEQAKGSPPAVAADVASSKPDAPGSEVPGRRPAAPAPAALLSSPTTAALPYPVTPYVSFEFQTSEAGGRTAQGPPLESTSR